MDSIATGSGNFDDIESEFTFGTGSPSQANMLWHDQRTVAATTSDDLDLAGSLTNAFGETITFTAVKLIIVSIDSPDGTKSLRVGPQNGTNPWQGPFGGTTAAIYLTVYEWLALCNSFSGYGTITAGSADTLRIYNPGAGSVTYNIVILGVAS